MDEDNAIGAGNALPWPNLRADMVRFKTLTDGKTLIMGRKTFESLPGVLPGRPHIVISRTSRKNERDIDRLKRLQSEAHLPQNVRWTTSLEDAVDLAHGDIMVIGGGQIFRKALPWVDTLYLTLVHQRSPTANVFFPSVSIDVGTSSKSDWCLLQAEHVAAKPNTPVACTFFTLARREVRNLVPVKRTPSIYELQQDLPLPPHHYPNP